MLIRSCVLAFLITFQATVSFAQVTPRLAAVYGQLEKAVANQAWEHAQELITQLMVLQPERFAELFVYQQRLQRLAGSLPPLPSPSPDPVPFEERLRIHSVNASVKTTRQAFETLSSITYRGCRGIIFRTPITLPDIYEVIVRVMGPTGLPTQRIPVHIALNDGEMEITPEFLLGSQAIASYRFTFRGSQVPSPRMVRVTLPSGVEGSFALDVPSANTILKRGSTRVIPAGSAQTSCLGPRAQHL